MNFRNWLEQINNLPPIPPGFQRLTHFTNINIANQLIQGADFKAPKGLSSTTDVFNNNLEVIDLIETGKTGAFTRDNFGTAVVLMDMSPQEYRIRANYSLGMTEVPNDRIVGYYNKTSNQFIPNPGYSPNQTLPEIPQQNNRFQKDLPTPVPQPTLQSNAPDVW